MKIRTKLAMAFSACVLLTASVGFFGFRGLAATQASLNEIGEVRVPSLVGLADVLTGQQVVRANNGLLINSDTAPAQREKLYASIEQGHATIKQGWDVYAPLPQTPEEAKLWEQFVPAFETWQADARALTQQLQHWQQLAKQDAPQAEVLAAHAKAKEQFAQLATHYNASRSLLDSIWKLNVDVANESLTQGYAGAKASTTMLVAGLIAAVVVSVGFAAWMFMLFSRKVSAFIGKCELVAKGDLTERVPAQGDDEFAVLGTSFNKLVENVQTMISQIHSTSGQVAAAATEIAASAEEMNNTLRTQEQEAQQVSAAVAEMTASINEVATKAGDAATAAKQSGARAAQGSEVVERTVQEVRGISDEVSTAASSVKELATKAEAIGQVISVINDIADQTNLLALNAAIEAARAGEHGRGFAVVADEVRKLAERTQSATAEVAKSVREIQGGTGNAVARIESCTGRATRGVDLAGDAGRALGEITEGSSTLDTSVNAIAASAKEQATASDQVARSIERINAGAQESTQAAGQAAQAASSLSTQAEELRRLVGQFRVEPKAGSVSSDAESQPNAKRLPKYKQLMQQAGKGS
jgi:methyl-accepting chemotaxis protein